MPATAYPHIDLAPDGTPLIAGTPTRVIDIVLDRLAHHWDADEIQRQHPHLSLAQIYAALTYYHDHQSALDADISRRLAEVDRLQGRHPTHPHLLAKLRSRRTGAS